MRVLALDLSTHTGWAFFEGKLSDKPNLLSYGEINSPVADFNVNKDPNKSVKYPLNILLASKLMTSKIKEKIDEFDPHIVVCEQTVRGKNRHTQRCLEFFHKDLLELYYKEYSGDFKFVYMDPSEWRKILNIRLSNEDKKNNKLVTQGKKRGRVNRKHLSIKWIFDNYDIKLPIKRNNESDAICLGAAFYLRG